jgi:hypothetical protein
MAETIEGARDVLVESGTVAGEASPGGFPRQAEDPVALRTEEVRAGIARGWAFTPLNGKKPILKAWQKRPKPRLDEALVWARQGNIGLRTGAISGVVVVDIDPGAETSALDLPRTVTVVTGRGGRHLYFRAPDVEICNSAGKLAEHVDFRGDGGQAAFVGSAHPDTGQVYRWADDLSPDDVVLAPLPDWILHAGKGNGSPASDAGAPAKPDRPRAYAQKCLRAELEKVRTASEGQRNDQLNKSAFNLGRLIASGDLDRADVERELLVATALPDAEARPTIQSGIDAGMLEPRGPAQGRHTVLVPGGHRTDDGAYKEVSEKEFAQAVLHAIPEGQIYRRGEPGVPGELLGSPGSRYFNVLDSDSSRLLIGEFARLCKWTKATRGEDPKLVVCPVTKAHAGLVLAEARGNDRVRRIELIAPYPAYGCMPGWNANGIYCDLVAELVDLEPELDSETIHCALEDLLIDFPFADEASRQNFIGLMLTPLLRPIIEGNVPLHLVASPLERTGKTKLCEEIFGGTLLGYPTPALQLSGSEEEIDKRIVGLLLKGTPLVHLDNLRAYVDSPALSSLITASRYQGRVLSTNAMPALSNQAVLVASGNNVHMSGEMAKRTVPILLQPSDDAPELRRDFKHPDLRAFVRDSRRLNLACLLGMIARWEQQGRPQGEQRLGGFEAWCAIVGGVMRANRFDRWLTNARDWQRQADPHGEDLITFVRLWRERHGEVPVSANQLMALADENDLFLDELRGATEKGKLGSFSKRVLGRHKDTPVRGRTIRQLRTGAERLWKLEQASANDTS